MSAANCCYESLLWSDLHPDQLTDFPIGIKLSNILDYILYTVDSHNAVIFKTPLIVLSESLNIYASYETGVPCLRCRDQITKFLLLYFDLLLLFSPVMYAFRRDYSHSEMIWGIWSSKFSYFGVISFQETQHPY